MTSTSLGSSILSAAGTAIAAFDAAIATNDTYRSDFMVHENRLEHALANVQVGYENQASAESRLRDADLPDTMSTYTRQQILLQSTTAMLAQANAKPFTVLMLLQ